jgi:hypothetical protein
VFHRVVGQLPVYQSGSAHPSSDKMIPTILPWENFVCRLGSVTPPRVDGQTDVEVFPSQVIPWFRMSTSRKPASLNEDAGTHVLGLKTKRGIFGGFRSINECHPSRSPQHQECGAYRDAEIGLR